MLEIIAQNDSLVLEDESGRIALGGVKLGPHVGKLVTGVVLAVRGTVDDNGVLDVSVLMLCWSMSLLPLLEFLECVCVSLNNYHSLQVIDWVFSHTLHDHLPSTPVTAGPVPTATSKYLLLVSGLQVGNPGASNAVNASSASSELSAQLLVDFVSGRLGGQQADIDIASKIVR